MCKLEQPTTQNDSFSYVEPAKSAGNPCRYRIIVLPLQSNEPKRGLQNAEIAQLVERNLAKVEVASSSLVFRSGFEESKIQSYPPLFFCSDVRAESSISAQGERPISLPLLPADGQSSRPHLQV